MNVHWQLLIGVAVIVTALVGIFWLRSHPPPETDDAIYALGRAVPTTAYWTRRVLRQLQQDGALVADDLRRRVNMLASDFYELIRHLRRRNLIREVQDDQFVVSYELTDDGIAEVERVD